MNCRKASCKWPLDFVRRAAATIDSCYQVQILQRVNCLLVGAASVFVGSAGLAYSQTPVRLIPFQGKLTDAAGQAVPDGARKIQFKLYDALTGGTAVWPGEVHTATVNAGLVNVLLGSQSLFTDPSIFNQTLYLEITADVNADGILNQSDPPMLPRQLIVPVIFAPEAGRLEGSRWQDFFVDPNGGNPKDNPSAARVKDAAKLRDREWSDFFTTESVVAAKAKNADFWDGIDTAALLTDATNTTFPKVKLAANADNAGSVNVDDLVGQIQTGQIADGAVSNVKTTSPDFSSATGVDAAASPQFSREVLSFQETVVTESAITLSSNGRPIMLMLSGGNVFTGVSILKAECRFRIQRNGDNIAEYIVASKSIHQTSMGAGNGIKSETVPSGAISFIDLSPPAAGQVTYRITMQRVAGPDQQFTSPGEGASISGRFVGYKL